MIWSHFGMQTTVSPPSVGSAGAVGAAAFLGDGTAAAFGEAGGDAGAGACAFAVGCEGATTSPYALDATAADAPLGTGIGVAGGAAEPSGGGVAPGGGAAEAVGGGVTTGVATVLNAVRAAVNGPTPLPEAAPRPGGAAPRADDVAARGDELRLVVEMIAITTPAKRSAIEHERAATTHMGGRRLKRWAAIVR